MAKYLVTLTLLLSQLFLQAQAVPDKIVAALDTFSFIEPQEKVYIQTDRNSYLAGEAIWLKAYCIFNEKPTILSKIVYVELVNEDGKLVEKRMLKLVDGSANGVIDTKSIHASGNYTLRAYTLWMLNFPDFIFERKIAIINSLTPKGSVKKNVELQEISFTIFPEGGNLISTIKNNIAFKTIDQNSNPIDVSGYVLNAKNEKIVSFSTVNDGMGKFEFIPAEAEIYKAVITTKNGKQKTVTLPKAYSEGALLSVDNSNINKTFVSVSRSENNKAAYNNLILVAQINYQIAYIGKINIDEGLDALAINKKNLPAGIMQICLLTEDGKPLAERLVFVANHKLSKDLIKGNNINFEKRAKNTLEVDVNEFKNLSAAISITNGNSSTLSDNSILSTFLLSSDIKGRIHNPTQYFVDKEQKTLDNLDLIMLSNGWRRFKLENILANKFSLLDYPFETGLTVSGKVLESNGRSFLKAGKINLIINGEDSTKIISQANTNNSSGFIIDKIDFKKEATIFYQGTNLNNKEAIVSVLFNPSFFDTLARPALRANKPLVSTDTLASSNYYDQIILDKQKAENAKGKTLDNIILTSKKKSSVDSLNTLYATDIFYESDQTIPVNTLINTGDILQFLRGIVPGISIIRSDTGTQVNFTRYQGADYFSENGATGVQFFLNEVPVSIDVIESLFAEDIGLVKVYKGNTAIAIGADRGAIGLYTVKGKSTRDWRKKGFDFIKKLGYAVDREFSEIDYAKINPNNEFADVRTTIYWNPSITIKDGKALLAFYNDDVCKKFKVVLEGVDADGKLLHVEKELN